LEWTWRRGGAGGTVLPRRRSRGNPAVACFTRNTSSLAASFYNARLLSEVVRLEDALALSHQRVLLAYTAAHASAGLRIFNNLGGRGSRPKWPLLAQCDNAVLPSGIMVYTGPSDLLGNGGGNDPLHDKGFRTFWVPAGSQLHSAGQAAPFFVTVYGRIYKVDPRFPS